MKKLISILFSTTFLFSSPSFSSISVHDVVLNINSFTWQVRYSYPGIWSTDVGYFYINNWVNDIGIYTSSRNIDSNTPEAFYESLFPLEDQLLPYTTPSWTPGTNYTILSQEDSIFMRLPSKKLLIKLEFPDGKNEILTTYLVTREKYGLFSNTNVGYSFTFSCYEENLETDQPEITLLTNSLYF